MTTRDKRKRSAFALAAALTTASAGLTLAGAPPSEPPVTAAANDVETVDRFAGRYRHAGGERERKARDDAIDDVVDDMNFIVRGIARSRLREANPIAKSLGIAKKGKMLTITFDKRHYTGPIDGRTVKVVGVTGDEVSMRFQISNGRIRQIFQGDDGGRVNDFSLDGEGRVALSVRVHSDKLPKDLRYQLTYAK
jgi:hypothetical protein